MEIICDTIGDNGVSSIVTTLTSSTNIYRIAQDVDKFSLALIAPLRYSRRRKKKDRISVSFSCELSKALREKEDSHPRTTVIISAYFPYLKNVKLPPSIACQLLFNRSWETQKSLLLENGCTDLDTTSNREKEAKQLTQNSIDLYFSLKKLEIVKGEFLYRDIGEWPNPHQKFEAADLSACPVTP